VKREAIVRLNAHGSPDDTFRLNPELIQAVLSRAQGMLAQRPALALQQNGKLIVAGLDVDGPIIGGIARLLPDGLLDRSFDVGNGISDSLYTFEKLKPRIWQVAVQPDGKILIGGDFRKVNGVPRNGIARLHGDPLISLTLTESSRPTHEEFGFDVTASLVQAVVVEVSSDLASPRWLPLSTNELTDGRIKVTDTALRDFPQRFYRARSSP